MKKTIPFLLLVLSSLTADPLLYEGFNTDGQAAGCRIGWLSEWHRLAGEVGSLRDSLKVPGLDGGKGALLLEKKGEALAQVNVDVKGTFYGSFRFRAAKLKNDSILGLVIAKPDPEKLSPKTATISLLLKGWRSNYAVLLANGKAVKAREGNPIKEKQTYMVLFKIENPKGKRSKVNMWILSREQVLYFANQAISQVDLNSASLGAGEGSVMQSLQLEAKNKEKLELSKGDVVACIAKFNSKAIFDEIRLTQTSLGDALGNQSR